MQVYFPKAPLSSAVVLPGLWYPICDSCFLFRGIPRGMSFATILEAASWKLDTGK